MYYKASDIHQILEDIKEKYSIKDSYEFDKNLTPDENIDNFRFQIIRAYIIPQILMDINQKLNKIEKTSYNDFSLDIPTKCDNCFALRTNGVCHVCAFTGDLSESGFYQKYGLMEHCPFLTQKQVDNLAYDFIKKHFNESHQNIVDDVNDELRKKIELELRNSFNSYWGERTD